MKKPIHLICILFFTFTFSSCENREKQADKLAEQFMLKNLNDPSSYQLVERGPIDSLYSQYRFTDEAQHLVDRMKQIADSAARYSASVSTVPKAQRLIADGQRLLRRYHEKQKTFPSRFLGFAYTVRFRARNDKGAIVRSYVVFRLSPDADKITIEDGDLNIVSLFSSEVLSKNLSRTP